MKKENAIKILLIFGVVITCVHVWHTWLIFTIALIGNELLFALRLLIPPVILWVVLIILTKKIEKDKIKIPSSINQNDIKKKAKYALKNFMIIHYDKKRTSKNQDG